MTNKTQIAELQDLKSMAEDAAKIYGDTWDSALVGDAENGNYHAITSEKTEDVVVRAIDDSRHSSWLCDYLEAVSPKKIINLLDRLEAAEARIAELEINWEASKRAIGFYKKEIAKLKGDAVPLPENIPCPSAPDFVWLQTNGYDSDESSWPVNNLDEVSWCVDKVFRNDTLYVRSDLFTHAQPVQMVVLPGISELIDACDSTPAVRDVHVWDLAISEVKRLNPSIFLNKSADGEGEL